MSNSYCSPYSAKSARFDFSCYGTTGPYITDTGGRYNLTIPEYPAINQTGQATMDALRACCKAPVTNADDYGEPCFSNCKTTGLEQALEVEWCLGNYTEKRPQYFFANLGCNTMVSGATMLGRSSSWGGLVVLSLVVSAAATMM
ncbi:hypothetical protein ACLOAV_001624 [Pseudogymnoascus australis]